MVNVEITLHPSSSGASSSPFNHMGLIARIVSEPDLLQYVYEIDTVVVARDIMEQRLIERWKENLRWEPTLQMCRRHNFGATSHHVRPQARELLRNHLTNLVFDLLYNNPNPNPNPNPGGLTVKSILLDYLSLTPPDEQQQQPYLPQEHLLYFTNSSAPQALVMLYTSSSHQSNNVVGLANDAIRDFITKSSEYQDRLPNYKHTLALVFSRWLSWAAGIYDPLYLFCRASANLIDHNGGEGQLRELANRLLYDLELSKDNNTKSAAAAATSNYVGPALRDVKDLSAFLVLVNNEIMALDDQILPLTEEELCALPLSYAQDITCLHRVFFELLHKLDECLLRIEEEQVEGHTRCCCCHYLAILKELNTISKLYHGAEEVFRETMKQRKVALSYLIVRFVKRFDDDHKWILEAKEATNFETRRHLAMMMLPKEESPKWGEDRLIDRSHLFAESFEYIARADPGALRAGISIEFKNERGTGYGVIKEWLYLVCQEIFNPQNTLFMACPSDRRRFFPNPASKVDPLHLEYFGFSGRVVALALVHKVQIGIVFDRVFSLQLAGYSISIEDIRDADPYLYSSCKKILEMDPDAVDQDVMALTFVHEVEEFGKRKVEELCPGGRSMVVNSKNRKQYVDSLIQHRFVTAVGAQIAHFAQGFADVMSYGSLQRSFFQCLELEDLDRMLYGSESAISVDDWMAHTEYHGFKKTDSQISWFWKVVECMSTEQKRALLFFWTSIRYLPAEGFNRLPLSIYKTSESFDHLPSSRTCFHLLSFPAYPSQAIMRDRLQVITQEHVCFSFGDGAS